MRRTMLVIAWAVVTAAATTVAWQAVAVVGANVTPQAARPVPAADLPRPTTAAVEPPTPDVSTAPTTPQPETTPAPAPTAPTPSIPDDVGETRTVSSRGGTASVRFSDGGVVELLWARPEPGFATEVVRQEVDRVEIEFAGGGHTSRIRARWVGGPDVEVNESGG